MGRMIDCISETTSIDCHDGGTHKHDCKGSGSISKKLKKTVLASQNVETCEAAESQDLLGDLPDFLLHHILSFMETKVAIRTCVLSKRWRYLWTSVPCLNFNSRSFTRLTDFKRFVLWVLSHRDSAHVKALTYSRFGVDYATDQSLLTKVIEYAVSHGAEEIRINLRAKSFGSPPIEIPFSIFTCQSLKVLEIKDCCYTNASTSFCFKSLENLYLDNFRLHSAASDSSNPFASYAEFFGFTTLTTLHLNRITLACTGTDRVDPFANCVNLKNLHLSGICFKSDLNPEDFVISAPRLNKLTMICNRFKCKLVVSAPQLTNFSYLYSTSCAFFEFNLPSLHDLVIDIHELHGQVEKSQEKQKEEALLGFINMLRGHHRAEAVKLSFSTVKVNCGTADLLKHGCSFSELKSLNLEAGSTYKIFIDNLDHITAYYRDSSQHVDFEIVNV
ncbi:hypothetical protein L6164_021441 [Bauhinia variegata]|uniref:Uncharacterized protein n=1 Tax=Bauhinia variegata TaxID=167791 RepID=A0ACB9MZ25_BAUVA|nr:hypothetical protein L6164_021441 [Bauhinia variegata]